MNRKRWTLVAVALGAVAVMAVAGMAGKRYMQPDRFQPSAADDSPAPESAESPEGSESPPSTTDPALVEFRDEKTGVSISHPRKWERLDTPDPGIVLIAVGSNERDSVQVRTTDLGFKVGPEELEDMRGYTENAVRGGEDVEILTGPSRVELGGLPGYAYVYTFAASESERGVHSHYFLFDGDTMITIILQVVPQDRFGDLAPVFDAIADSFRVR